MHHGHRSSATLVPVFAQTADLYDAFYDALEKDYAWEARTVLRLARARRRRPRTLVDVACGTGRHLEHFARTLSCVGVDVSPAMLRVAADRCPGVPLVQADMRRLDLGDRFDIVTCLFSSVAYMRTVPDLRRAVRAMARHLAPGGVLLVEPWFEPEEWEDGHLAVLVVDDEHRKAARISRSGRRRDLSVLDFDYLVADAAGTRHTTERHELRLFRRAQYLAAFETAGLIDVALDDYGLFGRGLVIGTAPR